MLPICYRAYKDDVNSSLNNCNRESAARPLMVNCAGNFVTSADFKTDNLRTRDDYYLLYISSGSLNVTVADSPVTLGAGAFMIFPPKYRYRYSHSKGARISYLWIHFTGSSVLEILKQYGIELFPKINRLEHSDVISMRFQNIFNAFIRNDRFRDSELSLLLERLLISLGRRVYNEQSRSQPLTRSIYYINGHYNKDLRIPELARLENLSTSRYNTVFRKTMNMSPIEYITKLRISMACDLLSSTDISVKAVADMVGYSDAHFFSRVFKKHIGESPTEYRSKSAI